MLHYTTLHCNTLQFASRTSSDLSSFLDILVWLENEIIVKVVRINLNESRNSLLYLYLTQFILYPYYCNSCLIPDSKLTRVDKKFPDYISGSILTWFCDLAAKIWSRFNPWFISNPKTDSLLYICTSSKLIGSTVGANFNQLWLPAQFVIPPNPKCW